MIRVATFLMAIATQASAWEFSPGNPCVLTHETDSVEIRLTYDPDAPLYTIALTQAQPFSSAQTFSMQFQGAMPISIATDRHQLSDGGRTLTVSDSGFGNVLNGLQFNLTATATHGTQAINIPLAGAAAPVAAFRACDFLATS